MEANYNILWLDDWFADENEANIPDFEKIKRRKFQNNDVAPAQEMGFNVKGIISYADFFRELKNISSYHAIILDICGMKNEKGEVDNDTIMNVIELLKEEQVKIPIYIYSASDEHPDIRLYVKKYREQGHVFNKTGGVDNLLAKIRGDLNAKYHLYIKHEECLKLITHKYLPQDIKIITAMENILSSAQLDNAVPPYNDIRKIIEGMFQTLRDKEIIDVPGDLTDKVPFNQCVDYIAKRCPLKDDGTFDYNHPVIPFTDCNQETKYLILFLGYVSNFNSHFITGKDCDSYLGAYYDNNFKQATYAAFFAIMKWYYTFMHDNYPHS